QAGLRRGVPDGRTGAGRARHPHSGMGRHAGSATDTGAVHGHNPGGRTGRRRPAGTGPAAAAAVRLAPVGEVRLTFWGRRGRWRKLVVHSEAPGLGRTKPGAGRVQPLLGAGQVALIELIAGFLAAELFADGDGTLERLHRVGRPAPRMVNAADAVI